MAGACGILNERSGTSVRKADQTFLEVVDFAPCTSITHDLARLSSVTHCVI